MRCDLTVSKKQLSKSVLTSVNPKARRCKECPRWESMCKGIYAISPELPNIKDCPIWNGSYSIDTKLWYHQKQEDIISKNLSDVEFKLESLCKALLNDLKLDVTYEMINDEEFELSFSHSSESTSVVTFNILKRKIDWIVHDNEFLYNLLGKLEMYDHFVKSYQIMKKRYKKIQLRGGSNKLYIEAYDLIKFDDLIYNFLIIYIRVLDGVMYEAEIVDCERAEKKLKGIW